MLQKKLTTVLAGSVLLAGIAMMPKIGYTADDTSSSSTNDSTTGTPTDTTGTLGSSSQGTSTDASGGTYASVNINTASKSELMNLPGISDSDAQKIIDNRPYKSADDLVDKKVLTASQYKNIQRRITAGM